MYWGGRWCWYATAYHSRGRSMSSVQEAEEEEEGRRSGRVLLSKPTGSSRHVYRLELIESFIPCFPGQCRRAQGSRALIVAVDSISPASAGRWAIVVLFLEPTVEVKKSASCTLEDDAASARCQIIFHHN